MSRVVHVLFGSSAAASFRQARIAADRNDVLTLRDHLSCGPLLPIADPESWTSGRIAYWRELGFAWREEDEEDVYLDPLGLQSSDEIVVWPATDLADQIGLVWLPAFLRALDAQDPTLKVVQFERNPRGLEVTGLGMLSPQQIAAHPPPVTLTGEQFAELDAVWRALTAPEPAALLAQLAVTSRLPILARALRESITRYPDAGSGLNAWELRVLRSASRMAPKAARVIGDALAAGYEELRAGTGGRDQIGDGWLFTRMLRLGDPKLPRPALEITGSRVEYHDTEVRLTPFGRQVLDGKANFVDANGIDDWVFGVHLDSNAGRVWFHRDGALIRR